MNKDANYYHSLVREEATEREWKDRGDCSSADFMRVVSKRLSLYFALFQRVYPGCNDS